MRIEYMSLLIKRDANATSTGIKTSKTTKTSINATSTGIKISKTIKTSLNDTENYQHSKHNRKTYQN